MTDTSPKRERPEADLTGRVLGERYRVLRHVAEGGMGVVYEAEDLLRGRAVAVKTLHAHLARDPQITSRFEREVRVLEAISHPNVIEILDSGTLDGGDLYLVLEWLEGQDLAKALQAEGPMSVGRVARILQAIAEGVAVAHDQDIIHRDLKPENVFLVDPSEGHERVKVMDFGIARYHTRPDETHTRTGTTLGTPYYMAPEQAKGQKDLDRRVDVYALGVVGFRLLTGHYPFAHDSYPMLVVLICTEPPPSIRTWRADLPRELEALLDRMMSKEPSARPSTMREVAEALAPFTRLDAKIEWTGAAPPAPTTPSAVQRASAHDPTLAATPGPIPETRLSPRLSPHLEPELEHDEVQVVTPRTNPIALFVSLGLGVVVLLLAAWFLLRDDDPQIEADPAAIALPSPEPPVTRALGSASSGAGAGEGWVFLNPLPRTMPQWHAVAAERPDLVAMVGSGGVAARFVGPQLRTWPTETSEELYGVAWTSAEEALAVGDEGTIVRLTSARPRPIGSGVTTTLRAVRVISATEQLVAGDEGVLLRVLGDRVLPIALERRENLLDIDVRRGRATVVGSRGTVIDVVDGRATRIEAPTSQTLRAVGGCEGSQYVAGDEGVLLWRGASGFRPVRLDPPARTMFTSIGCDRGRTVVVGANGDVRLVSGLSSVKLDSGFDGTWTGVAGATDEATWIVGSSGRLAVIVVNHVETRTSGPIASLRDISDIGGALVAVGDWGRIVRQQESGLVLDQSPSEAALASLARLDERGLVAVGDAGTVLHLRFEGATVLDSTTDSGLRGVVSDGHAILAVGAGGVLVRGTLDSLASTRLADVENLTGVTGRPSDALAVGDGGVFVTIDERGSRVRRCGSGFDLRAVHREAPGAPAWAVGAMGAIVRIEPDGRCVLERGEAGLATLHGIGRGPDGNPLAVGDRGTALQRDAEGRWEPVELDVGAISLQAVRSIDRWVFVVGAGGVILRHIRVDGG